MEPADIVDEVNALLKLGVGDAYRLEHIKQAYIENKTIWVTDQNYLQRMKEKYLNKQKPEDQVEGNENSEEEFENKETIHCWKCGKKTPLGANFCMLCGSSLFEVGTNNTQNEKTSGSINQLKIGLKIPMIVGIPVLILIIIGGAYGLGYFDNAVEKEGSVESKVIPSKVEQSKETSQSSTSSDSKCGPGTIFDSEANSCVLDNGVDPDKINSKCGPGTIFDSESNSCVLDE